MYCTVLYPLYLTLKKKLKTTKRSEKEDTDRPLHDEIELLVREGHNVLGVAVRAVWRGGAALERRLARLAQTQFIVGEEPEGVGAPWRQVHEVVQLLARDRLEVVVPHVGGVRGVELQEVVGHLGPVVRPGLPHQLRAVPVHAADLQVHWGTRPT